MRRFVWIATSFLACAALHGVTFASTSTIKPTTTLSAETTNNTSTASSFTASTNGNIAPTNVSKIDTHTLLYPGATTKIYTNIMHWFGPKNHIQVGYKSDDLSQVQKQVDDHVSRGIDGAIVDWYGPSHVVDDTATQLMMRYAETLPGLPFQFAIMEDKGALLSCSNTPGCDMNRQLVSDLTYIYNMYEGSPAYMKVDGRPAVFFFGLEFYSIDWNYVAANVPGNPAFIFQNTGGYTHPATAGAFSWVMINTSNPNDWKQSYIDDFYYNALKNPGRHTWGTAYKGFDDTMASWSLNRIMNQNCGQAWLNTWNEAGRYYSSGRQLENLQIATWNDYEEGTEIETGIESCVSVSGATTGDSLTWAISGNENTIDHYTVFISQDGQNLMPLADATRGIRALDLTQFNLGPGTYTLYVKAVGKPSMTNKMSDAVSYMVPDPKPNVVLTVTPPSGIAPVTVQASTAGSTSPTSTIAASTINFGDGTSANGSVVPHTYTAPGTYLVTATVTDAKSNAATTTAVVMVEADKPPMAVVAITPSSGTAPVTVTATTSSSTDPDDAITGSTIDFGDGTVVNATTASHTYTNPGRYIVVGTVTDSHGAWSSSTASVNVAVPIIPGAVAIASPTSGSVVPSRARIVASATANTGNVITAVRIYVDNLAAYTVPSNAVDTYLSLSAGNHNVVVQAWDNSGIVYKKAITITATQSAPTTMLSVTPVSTQTGKPVAVSMAGTTAVASTISRYIIDFGDGFTALSMAATHSYSKPGTYTVKATAIDSNGLSSSATKTVTVTAVDGVTVSLPASGSSVTSSVRLVASATSQKNITAMRIYVDGVDAYTVGSGSLDTSITLAPGTRNVVVQAWDASGTVFKTPLTLNVR